MRLSTCFSLRAEARFVSGSLPVASWSASLYSLQKWSFWLAPSGAQNHCWLLNSQFCICTTGLRDIFFCICKSLGRHSLRHTTCVLHAATHSHPRPTARVDRLAAACTFSAKKILRLNADAAQLFFCVTYGQPSDTNSAPRLRYTLPCALRHAIGPLSATSSNAICRSFR